MRQTQSLMISLLLLSCIFSSCKKDMFDADTAKKIMELSFHNDSVDKNHDWTLISDWKVRVKANVKNVQRIELLSGNPYTNDKAEIVAVSPATEDTVMVMSCSLPVIADSLFAAAVDGSGRYYVVPIVQQEYVDFSGSDVISTGTLHDIGQQEMYYCYCSSYPEPSDKWGYNDCVLRIWKQQISSRTICITVTLQAVGTTKQIAAALRLAGVNYDQVEKIELLGGSNFKRVDNLPRYYIRDDNVLLRGQDGSAVINMFDDAHAAFYNKTSSQGVVFRYRYNVKHGNTADYYEFVQPSVGYVVTFKEEGLANTLTYSALDPFLLVNYGGTTWEVHKYLYKFNETLYSYYSGNPSAYDNGFAWALEIPYTWFRYPLAGESMGSYKKGVLYGAYQTFGHSFGEWGTDRQHSRDWYLYPNNSIVY